MNCTIPNRRKEKAKSSTPRLCLMFLLHFKNSKPNVKKSTHAELNPTKVGKCNDRMEYLPRMNI
jgi:hypothetical protein